MEIEVSSIGRGHAGQRNAMIVLVPNPEGVVANQKHFITFNEFDVMTVTLFRIRITPFSRKANTENY